MVQGAICIFFIVKRTGLFYAHIQKMQKFGDTEFKFGKKNLKESQVLCTIVPHIAPLWESIF